MSELQAGTQFILDTRVFPNEKFAFYPTRHVTGVIEHINSDTDTYKYIVKLKGVERENRVYLLKRSEILLLPTEDYTLTDIINKYPNPLAVLQMYGVKHTQGTVDTSTIILQARYQQGANYSYKFVRQCQGTILDKDLNILFTGFEKFFNRNEPNAPKLVPNKLYEAIDKSDGSQVRMGFYPDGTFFIGSRQTDRLSVELPNGLTLKDVINKAINFKEITDICNDIGNDTQLTHLFELISPENKIVVHYDSPELVYLGSSFVNSNGDFEIVSLPSLAKFSRESQEMTIQELEDRCHTSKGIEGWVIKTDNAWEYVKFKTEWYFEKHKLYALESPSVRKIVTSIKDGTVDDLRQSLISNNISTDCITDVEIKLFSTITKHINYAESFKHLNKELPRKEYATKAFKELDSYTASLALKALDSEISMGNEIDTLFIPKLMELVK